MDQSTRAIPSPDPTAADLEKHEDADETTSAKPEQIDPSLERSVVKKLDRNLIPLVTVLFLLSFLDRSNIGNARIAGMSDELHLEVNGRYDWLLTIFYISYIVFEFQIVFWKIFPPHVWAAFIVFFWGIISTCQAATTNWGGMMALRFLLGVAEGAFLAFGLPYIRYNVADNHSILAGYGPGVPYLLSFFYLRKELGFRCGMFFAAAPLASCFAGALAYGITSGHASIANWRLLFIVEGIPSIIMAPVAFFFLPDSPSKARFLNNTEKTVAAARGVRQAGKEERVGRIDLGEMAATAADPKPWLTALMYFSCNVSYSSLPVFLPTIIKQMGFDGVTAQGLSAPPFFLSAVVTVVSTWIADRTQQRGLMVIALSCIAGVGYILLATTESIGSRYTGTFLAAAGVFPAIGNILPWVMNNQGNDSRRGAGMVMLNVIGQCGPLLGTRVFPITEMPFYVKGQSICAAFMFFVAILALTLRTLLVWENKKLDRQYGTLEEQRARNQGKDETAIENYGPMYRFVL